MTRRNVMLASVVWAQEHLTDCTDVVEASPYINPSPQNKGTRTRVSGVHTPCGLAFTVLVSSLREGKTPCVPCAMANRTPSTGGHLAAVRRDPMAATTIDPNLSGYITSLPNGMTKVGVGTDARSRMSGHPIVRLIGIKLHVWEWESEVLKALRRDCPPVTLAAKGHTEVRCQPLSEILAVAYPAALRWGLETWAL